MRNTSKIGQVSVAQIICPLSNLGKYIYLPFGDHYRSDLVIEDEDGRFSRIQCKTARLVRGTVGPRIMRLERPRNLESFRICTSTGRLV